MRVKKERERVEKNMNVRIISSHYHHLHCHLFFHYIGMEDDMIDCIGYGSSSHSQRVGSFVSMANLPSEVCMCVMGV